MSGIGLHPVNRELIEFWRRRGLLEQMISLEQQLPHVGPGHSGDRLRLVAARLELSFNRRPARLHIGQIHFVQRHNLRFGRQVRIEQSQFAVYLCKISQRILRHPIQEMDQNPGALDMAEEGIPEARPLVSALDQPRDVRQNDGGIQVQFSDTQVRDQGCEWVGAIFGLALVTAASSVDLPALGTPTIPTSAISLSSRRRSRIFSRFAPLSDPGGLVTRSRIAGVTPSSSAPPANHQLLPGFNQVANQLPTGVVIHQRAWGNPDDKRLT